MLFGCIVHLSQGWPLAILQKPVRLLRNQLSAIQAAVEAVAIKRKRPLKLVFGKEVVDRVQFTAGFAIAVSLGEVNIVRILELFFRTV